MNCDAELKMDNLRRRFKLLVFIGCGFLYELSSSPIISVVSLAVAVGIVDVDCTYVYFYCFGTHFS